MKFPAVATAALVVALVPSPASAQSSLDVSAVDAQRKTLTICGTERLATAVARTATARVHSAGSRARLTVSRCEDGRWTVVRRGTITRRATLNTSRDADLRVQARGRTQFVRVGDGGTVDVPVSFRVRNVNRTPYPGGADGREYTVRGHLTGPAARIDAGDAATLYTHGHSFSEELWRYRGVAGYDFTAEMARQGHVSVTFDRLGYESSDKPNGYESSYPSEADVFSQIVDQMKAGSFTVVGRPAPRFARVALAGHSQAAIIGEIAASTFKNVDGVIHLSFVSDFASAPLLAKYGVNFADCFAAPQPANQQEGNPTGYAFRGQTEADFRSTNFVDADPAVVGDVTPKRNVDPCGLPVSVGPAISLNNVFDSLVTVPVLVAIGEKDPNFMVPPLAVRGQRDQYALARDKEFAILPGAGHALMLERTAPQLQRIVADWLEGHDF